MAAKIKHLPVPPYAIMPGLSIAPKRSLYQKRIDNEKYWKEKQEHFKKLIDRSFEYKRTFAEFLLCFKPANKIHSDKNSLIKIGELYSNSGHFYDVWGETDEEEILSKEHKQIAAFIENKIFKIDDRPLLTARLFALSIYFEYEEHEFRGLLQKDMMNLPWYTKNRELAINKVKKSTKDKPLVIEKNDLEILKKHFLSIAKLDIVKEIDDLLKNFVV